MKKGIKAASLFLVVLCAVSCGSQGETPNAKITETSAAAEQITDPVVSDPGPDLPEADYGGADFTYLANPRDAVSSNEIFVYTDGLNGETVNDAVYNRNLQIEKQFNIKIRMNEKEDTANVARQLILAEDQTFDVIDASATYLSDLAVEGYLYDFNSVPYVTPLTSDYWGTSAAEDVSIGGRLYIAACDISMRFFGASQFLFFNKQIIKDYSLDDPYQLIDKNNWTLAKMMEMINVVSKDLNGDGKFTDADQYGYLAGQSTAAPHFVTGSGVRFLNKTDDGGLVIADVVDRVQSVLETVSPVLNNHDSVRYFEELKNETMPSEWEYGYSLFAEGNYLFMHGGMGIMDRFRNMKDDFGVLPNPKYDESQDSYFVKTNVYSLMFAIPVNARDIERTGMIMEYSAWLSHSTLLPAFYESTIKQKIVRDYDRDIEMLELIRQSIHVDIDSLFRVGINDIVVSSVKNLNFASTFASKEKGFQNTVDKITKGLKSAEK